MPMGHRAGSKAMGGPLPAWSLTCVSGLMAGAPPREQCHTSPQGIQVRTQGHSVSPQQLQPRVARHQPCQRILSTAGHRAHQLLGDLWARRGGWLGGWVSGWRAGWGAGEQGGVLRSREGGWVAHLHGWGVGGTKRIRGSVHCHHAAAPAQPSDPGPNSVWKEGGQGPASLGGVGWVPPGLGASHTWGHCWDGGARPHTRGTMLRWGVQPYTTPGRRPIRKDPLPEGEAPPRGTRAAPHLPSRLPLRGPPRRAERRGALTSGDVTTAGGRGG